MRKRDLAILMLCAFAIFFSLQHEGDFSFREAWFHLSEEYPIKYEAERLPPPIVADLNGDGKKEVLVATHDAKIQVLEPHDRRVDEGFSEARVLAEVSLLPDKVRIASGRRAVAMATGVIDRTYKHGEVQKQVLVVVTSDWTVMCFDHNLKKLWETNRQEDFPHNAHHREIAISISNYTLKHGDSGLVIVGGRMEMHPHIHMDPFEEIGTAEKNAEQHRRSANEKEASENSGTVDLRHFAFYAFAGRSGILRWSRKNENIEAHSSDASQLIPQHNYRLDVHSLNSRHPGEFECREFRESILGVMPHRWDRREDTLFKLAHFRRHKRKTLKRISGKMTGYPFHKPEENHPPGKDSTKKISNLIGKAAKYASSAKSKKPFPYIPTITNYTQLWWVPNVVVAHQKEGIEAVHLASGRTLCKLHLQEGGLHADINGDGVLDHVQVVGGNGAEQTVVSGSMEVLRPCWAVATSGVPVREQLFNASICRYSPFNFFQHGEFSRSFGQNLDVSSLEVATPVIIPRSDGHRHRKGSHGDVIFLTNRGEVTSYAPGMADVVTYNIIASELCNLSRHEEAKMLLCTMVDKGVAPNTMSFTTLIDIYCKEGNFVEAKRLLREMKNKGAEPNIVTYNALIDGYSKKGKMKEAHKLRDEMEEKGFKPDIYTYTSLVHGECIYGKVDEAFKIFNEMPAKGLSLNVVAYTAMISGLSKEGRSDEAFRLFDEMKGTGLTPDDTVYSSLVGSLHEVMP